MTHRSTRRKWSPARKLERVLESLQSDTQLAELCRREGLSPNRIYRWRKQLLGSAEAIFGPRPLKNGPDPQTRKLSAENARMKDVSVEITAENLDLKNALGLSDHPHLPPELQHEVTNLVERTRQRSGWPARCTLATLEIGAARYYRWRRQTRGTGGETHTKIRPHTPTDNAEIERYHRTIGEQIEEHELADFAQARTVIAGIILGDVPIAAPMKKCM